jgi:hypothetical protein
MSTTFTIAGFPTAFQHGPAIGLAKPATWKGFTNFCLCRREGEKDGMCFVPARFEPEADGRHVRRLGKNLRARTLVVLDCETSKTTGEIPPTPAEVAEQVRGLGAAAVIYTSHSHEPAKPRMRVALRLSQEIDPQLPVVDIVAGQLGLDGVIDRGKRGTNSLFYWPSSNPGELAKHQTIIVLGTPLDGLQLAAEAGKVQAAAQAERDRIAAQAHAQAEARRQERVAAGLDPSWSLIAEIRARLPSLAEVLRAHDYAENNGRFRHPESESGSFGLGIKEFGGIERAYSFNGTDPLCPDNLPSWCGVKAIDVVDAVLILEFNGDRKKGLRELACRFGIGEAPSDKKARGKSRVLARKLFALLRAQVPQAEIEAMALREGARLGFTPSKIIEIAFWVCSTAQARGAV